jgi:hypothetical protein
MKKMVAVISLLLFILTLSAGISSLKHQYREACQILSKVQIAIDVYYTDEMKYPQVDSFDKLTMLVPRYLKELPKKDPWGNPFLIKFGKKYNSDTYWIASGGSDGKFEGWEQDGKYTDLKGKDIIYSMSGMVYGPKIKLK